MSVKKPIERIERRRKSLKMAEKSPKRKYVLIVGKSLSLQATDRFSAQRSVVNRQDWIKRKQTEKQKKAITITVSVNVRCVAVFIGLHTVSRNSVLRNVKR